MILSLNPLVLFIASIFLVLGILSIVLFVMGVIVMAKNNDIITQSPPPNQVENYLADYRDYHMCRCHT